MARSKVHLRIVLVAIAALVATPLAGVGAGQVAAGSVAIDADDIGGVVTGPKGPEAGVWVIAETEGLPTRLIKTVVTDDQGRYLVPDLPAATYAVWVRGYGLVDSPKVQATPGKTLNLTALPAPNEKAAAEYYPAQYWLALLQIPPKHDFPGTGAAGNGYAGVRVANSNQVTIRSNLIAHNANGGVTVDGTNVSVVQNTLSANYWGLAISGGSSDTIIGNKIGTSADGLSALPNTHEGIFISGGTGLFFSDNVVANNGGAGLAVIGNTTRAHIENNNISNNGGLPIDLGDDGATPNGSKFPPGPNAWQQYPVVTAASGNLIQGTTCPNCAVYIYRAIGNPAQPHGGGVFLSINTFANGSGQWGATLPAGVTAADITLTAFNAAGDSSEMSPRPQMFLPLIGR